MASRTLPNVGLKGFWNLGEDGWEDEMDRNLLLISVLAQGGAISKVSATPGSPTDGDVHIFDETHGTQPNKIAIRDASGWIYVTPQEGWLVYNRAANYFEKFDGTVWAQLVTGSSPASTTEVLTGTDASKHATPDSVASLWEQGTDIASAGTLVVDEGGYFKVTGTTAITDIDFATDRAGRKAWLRFAGALTLTHSATLILPTGANIATAAGDMALFVSEGSDIVRCLCYQRADGSALSAGGAFVAASTTEVLTGTDSSKGATSDAIAALWEQGSDIASAGTLTVGEGGHFHVTGTTTITDIDPGTDKAGRRFSLTFTGILTLTHNSSTLILPTGANITTAAGDTAVFVSEGSDVVRCISYTRADGTALAGGGGGGGGGVSTLGPGYNRTLATAAALTTAGFVFNYGGTSLVDGTPGVRAASGSDARMACAFGSYTTLTIFGTDCQLGFTETAANGKYVIQYNVGNGRWIFGRINAGGGYNSDGTQYSGFYGYSRTGNPTWMRARYSGGTMYFGLSSNGDTWNEWGTEGTGFLTPTRFHVSLGDLHYFALS